jgi:hypothetical protein
MGFARMNSIRISMARTLKKYRVRPGDARTLESGALQNRWWAAIIDRTWREDRRIIWAEF